MSGTAWAALSGVGFGVFQTLNASAVRRLENVYASTFLQLLVAAAILATAALVTEDPALLLHADRLGLALLCLAGVVHFFVGWTALNLSHARVGAARTSPLLATTPLFGLTIAVAVTGHLPAAPALAGIALTVGGAYLVGAGSAAKRAGGWRDVAFGLATAVAWAASAVLTVKGLDRVDSALLGVTVGVLTASLAYAVLLVVTRIPLRGVGGSRAALALKLLAGAVVALATWARWAALDDAAVGVVLALNLLSVPVVLGVTSFGPGALGETVTSAVWAGGGLVVAGGLVLILNGG